MKTKLVAVAVLVLLVGCSSNPKPGTPTVGLNMKHMAVMIADETTRAVNIADSTSALIQAAPVAQNVRDQYNCAVLKVIGAAASDTVFRVCGAVPTVAGSPVSLALAKVKAASSCASLKDAAIAVVGALKPLIDNLKSSTDKSVAFAGTVLEATIAFEVQVAGGGVPCSL